MKRRQRGTRGAKKGRWEGRQRRTETVSERRNAEEVRRIGG